MNLVKGILPCSEVVGVDCGLYCSTSKVACAKITSNILSLFTGLRSLADIIDLIKKYTNPAKMQKALNFIKTLDLKILISTIKNSASIAKMTFNDAYTFYSGFQNLMDVLNIDTPCKYNFKQNFLISIKIIKIYFKLVTTLTKRQQHQKQQRDL